MNTSPSGTEPDGLCGALDAVLVPGGFAAAHLGLYELGGQAIWCCGRRDFVARYPGLLPEADDDAGCVDLVVDFVRDTRYEADDDSWRVADVHLEDQDIGDVLRRIAEPAAAARADGLLHDPVGAATGSLVTVVEALLRAGRPTEDRVSS